MKKIHVRKLMNLAVASTDVIDSHDADGNDSPRAVLTPDGRWDLVSGDAACSINPANWRTDATPAVFDFDGQRVPATLDPTNHVVLVSGFAVKETPFSHSFPEGNLHLYDRTLYARQIRENALLRSVRHH